MAKPKAKRTWTGCVIALSRVRQAMIGILVVCAVNTLVFSVECPAQIPKLTDIFDEPGQAQHPLRQEYRDYIAKAHRTDSSHAYRRQAAVRCIRLAQQFQDPTLEFCACVIAMRLAADEGDRDGYASFLHQARELEHLVLNDEYLVDFYGLQGQVSLDQQDTTDAMLSFHIAALHADANEDAQLRTHAYRRLADNLSKIGAFRLSSKAYKAAIEASTQASETTAWRRMSTKLADLYVGLGNLKAAEELYVALQEETNEPLANACGLMGQANLALHRGEYQRAIEIVDGLELPAGSQLPAVEEQFLILLLARADLGLGNLEQSRIAIDIAFSLSKQVSLVPTQIVLAEWNLAAGAEAEGVLELERIASEERQLPYRLAALDALVKHYEQQQEYTQAKRFADQSYALRDEASETEADIAMLALQGNYQYTRQLRRLARNELAALAQSEAASRQAALSQRVSVASVLVVALIVATSLFSMNEFRRRREKRLKELEQRNNQELARLIEEKSAALDRELEERVELQRTLERKRRDEAIGKLTGNVAHDFNNLLQVVLSTNEYLRISKSELTPEAVNLLDISSKSATVGASIVKQMLAFARKQNLTPTTNNVDEYFEETSTLLQAAVGLNCSLEIENRCGHSAVLLDPTQLTTALINLLSNAVDAMPDGGVIRLVARRLNPLGRDAMDWPGLSDGEPSAKKFLAFDVIDQGKGISDSEKPLVFEPFYSTKPPATGTGLGLSSVHGFVMQSEGDVKIFDNPGGGTRVSMIFPMAVQHVRQPKMQLLRDRLEPCRILVVEDNEAVGQSLQTSLASRGFLVTLVSSGEAAIARLSEKSRDIDLVLSDVRMPGAVDGFALQRWTNEHLPALRFILMSGYSCGDSDVTSTFLQKPFTDEQLIECIRQELQSTEPQHRMRA